VVLRPAFEHKISFEKRNSIPDALMGIYRYKDKTGSVLYIGKGYIKTRSNSQDRREWGVHEIEYSSLPTDEDSLKWESYYIQSYQNEFGLLPPFNRISGHSQDV
jgi:excinuclease UvrABC nuclease subunit